MTKYCFGDAGLRTVGKVRKLGHVGDHLVDDIGRWRRKGNVGIRRTVLADNLGHTGQVVGANGTTTFRDIRFEAAVEVLEGCRLRANAAL